MLNEWSDRDPGPRPPSRWHVVALIFVGVMTVWGTAQMLWSLVVG